MGQCYLQEKLIYENLSYLYDISLGALAEDFSALFPRFVSS